MGNPEVDRWLAERGLPSLEEWKTMAPDTEKVKGALAVATVLPSGELDAGFTPWYNSALDDNRGRRLRRSRKVRVVETPEHMQGLPDPRPRTDIARVASLTKRLVDYYRKWGTLGLDNSILKELQIEAAKAGRADLTAEDIRRIAIRFLSQAEHQNEEAKRQQKVAEMDLRLRAGAADELATSPGMNRAQRRALAKQLPRSVKVASRRLKQA